MNKKIYFSDNNIFSKLSEILEKNSLKESPEEAALKDEESFAHIILRLSKDYLMGAIIEKDLILSLQKQLKISEQVAKNLVEDIKEKIIPLAEKIEIKEQSKKEQLITTAPTTLTNENQNIAKKPTIEEIDIASKPIEIKKTIDLPKKSDTYRESIE